MKHHDLILALTADLQPVRPHQAEREMALALGFGGVASLAALAATMGIQPGLAGPALGPFAIKAAYGLALAGIGAGAALHLARPGRAPRALAMQLTATAAGLASVAAFQLWKAGTVHWFDLASGSSWPWCSVRIMALALPILGAMLFMMQQQAPVSPRRAGAVAGLAAGGLASVIYGLACVEHSAAFVMLWYSAGIAAVSAIGWLLGPKLLRW